jgi:hypothetical protein
VNPPAAGTPQRPADIVLPGELERWVAKFLTRRALLCFLGAIGTTLAAAAVLWLTWQVIYFILWFLLLSFSLPSSATAVSASTWVIWGLLFVAYFTANWQRLEKLEFESTAKLRTARIAAILTDSPFLALTGPKTVGSFVKVVSVIALVGPGMVATAWKLFLMSLAGFRGSADKVAEVLKSLATVGVRIPLEELMRSESEEALAPTFAAVRLFDGVIVRSSDPVGLVLTDELREEVLNRVPPDQRHATAKAKTPPSRVAAPARPSAAAPRPTATLPTKAVPPAKAAPATNPKPASPTRPAGAPPAKPSTEIPPRRPKPPPKPPK